MSALSLGGREISRSELSVYPLDRDSNLAMNVLAGLLYPARISKASIMGFPRSVAPVNAVEGIRGSDQPQVSLGGFWGM